jgi:hypothetical protein
VKHIVLSLLPVLVVSVAQGQTPNLPSSATANIATENSQVVRLLSGPGNRVEGLLLQDGTFVMMPLGLSQKLPKDISEGTSVSAAGEVFTRHGSRTMHAQRLRVAGVSYENNPPVPPMPPAPPAHVRPNAPGSRPCPAAVQPPPPPAPPAGPAAEDFVPAPPTPPIP